MENNTKRITVFGLLPTEFACIVGRAKVIIVSPTVKELGFTSSPVRREAYQRLKEQGYGGLWGQLAVRLMCQARPEQGELHFLAQVPAKVEQKMCYGQIIDWPDGAYRFRHEIGTDFDRLPLDYRFVVIKK